MPNNRVAANATGTPTSIPIKTSVPALPQDHPQHVAALPAERHPDADFLGSLGHGIGNYTVEADGGEQRGEAGENREKQHREFSPQNRMREHVLHRARIRQWDVAIDAPDRALHRGIRLSGLETALRTAMNIEGHCVCARGHVDLRPRRRLQRDVPHVTDDADDLQFCALRSEVRQVFADRVLAWKALAAVAWLMIATGNEVSCRRAR